MKFGMANCIMLVLEKDNIIKVVGTELADGKAIKSLQECENFNYLLIIFSADTF